MRLIAPHPVAHPGGAGHTLLRRVLGIGLEHTARIDLLEAERWRVRLHDTGPDGSHDVPCDRPTALHPLWALDDDSARISVDGDPAPVVPGDMLVLPRGTVWRASAGLILAEAAAGTEGGPHTVTGPTHGQESFHGHNRQTTYPAPGRLRIERWKVTQPLVLPSSDAEYALLDLARPVALVWRGGTDLLAQGTLRVVPAGTAPVTVLPDGLGYVLRICQ